MRIVKVSASKNYDILIASGILEAVGEKTKSVFPKAKTVAIITDDNVKEFYLERVEKKLSQAGFSTVCFSIPPGEASKNAEQYFSLLNWLCKNKLTRSDIIIALGGGVVGDLAGFTAATYLRGIPFVQIPTTLLAMVDSSVGGKTGIDLPAGKNLAGTFYQPSLVLCDTETLNTLPEHVFKDGCAEVIKYGMLGSTKILEALKEYSHGDNLDDLIEQCISIKRGIVQRDEFDTGDRMLLNFGHTIAHAIEKLSGYKISHGFAVAAGMAVDTRAAFLKGLCPKECLDVLNELLKNFALLDNTEYSAQELFEAALHDKKRDGEYITNVVPCALGKCELQKIPAAFLLDWIETGLACNAESGL